MMALKNIGRPVIKRVADIFKKPLIF